MIFDSVYVFARGLQSLDRGATLRPGNISCDAETPWRDGSSLFNYINSVSSFSGIFVLLCVFVFCFAGGCSGSNWPYNVQGRQTQYPQARFAETETIRSDQSR